MTVTVPAAERTRPTDRSVASVPVVVWLTIRALRRMGRLPALVVPVVVMPLFFVVAFTGSFDGIRAVEGYPTDEVVNWVAAFAMLQGAAFAGVGAAGVIGQDLEDGFMDRLLTSPVRRSTLLVGPLTYSAVRALVPLTIVMVAGALIGLDLPGGIVGLALAYVGGVGLAVVTGVFGLGVLLRMRDFRAMSLVQMATFLVLFPSIGQVPLVLLSGWMHDVARINPVTNVLRMSRQGFIGDVTWADTWPGLVALGVGFALFWVWARYELSRLD